MIRAEEDLDYKLGDHTQGQPRDLCKPSSKAKVRNSSMKAFLHLRLNIAQIIQTFLMTKTMRFQFSIQM